MYAPPPIRVHPYPLNTCAQCSYVGAGLTKEQDTYARYSWFSRSFDGPNIMFFNLFKVPGLLQNGIITHVAYIESDAIFIRSHWMLEIQSQLKTKGGINVWQMGNAGLKKPDINYKNPLHRLLALGKKSSNDDVIPWYKPTKGM